MPTDHLLGNQEDEGADSYLNTGKGIYHTQGNILEYNPVSGDKGERNNTEQKIPLPLTHSSKILIPASCMCVYRGQTRSAIFSRSLGSYFLYAVSRYQGRVGGTILSHLNVFEVLFCNRAALLLLPFLSRNIPLGKLWLTVGFYSRQSEAEQIKIHLS